MSLTNRRQRARGALAAVVVDDGSCGTTAAVGPGASSAVPLDALDPAMRHDERPADPIVDAAPPRAVINRGRAPSLGGRTAGHRSTRSLGAFSRSRRYLADETRSHPEPGALSQPIESQDDATTDSQVPLSLSEPEQEPASLVERSTSARADAMNRGSYRPRRPRSHWRAMIDGIREFRDICGVLVNEERVQLTMIALIVINAIMMGLATFGFVQDNPRVNEVFQKADTAFLSVFTIEIGLQLIYHGFHLFLDAWLIFDFCIITLSWSLESLQVVRAFRIFRAFRLIARLDVLRNLLVALFAVAPSMAGIIALLVLIMYIYAVMCTVLFQSLYQDGYTDEDYFGTLFASLFTLFQMMTLDNWASIAREVRVAYTWAWAVFSSYLLMTSFILYSLVIAVVCDAVKVTEHQEEKDEQLREEGELHERIMLIEKQVMEMAEQQFSILENLTTTMETLKRLEGDESDDMIDAASAESDAEDISPANEATSYDGSNKPAGVRESIRV